MSREAFEAFYMTLDESEKLDLYRTTKPFRSVPIGDYKFIVPRSMYVGWQAAEQSSQAKIDQLRAKLEKAKELLIDPGCSGMCGLPGPQCPWCTEVADLTNTG